jgi:ABC-type phosphate/phosphonate transport system substrate-binding protein
MAGGDYPNGTPNFRIYSSQSKPLSHFCLRAMSIASLPMYDLPEIRSATNSWWQGLRRAFRKTGIADVPGELWRGDDYHEPWTRLDLFLSQTCGYPLVKNLCGKVSTVATPCYAVPECSGPNYCSIIIVREDNPASDIGQMRGARCVINSRDSQSGYNCLRSLIAPIAGRKRFFREVKVSGGHRTSAMMVANGGADVAAIDCITYALLRQHCPSLLAGTRALGRTPYTPGLPYITRQNADRDFLQRLRDGIQAASHDPALSECREILMIREFCHLSTIDYECLIDMETAAINSGYAELA